MRLLLRLIHDVESGSNTEKLINLVVVLSLCNGKMAERFMIGLTLFGT